MNYIHDISEGLLP